MTRILNMRLLPLICLAMSIGLISSCKKDNTGTTATELLSFGPTGAMHGDTLRFFGNNLNRVTDIVFAGNAATVPSSQFIQQTSQLILLIVPDGAEAGFVTLKTPQGDMVTKTRFNLSVASEVTTMTMQARPGENITLTGNFLNWVTSITFNRDKVVDTFVSQSINQIVVKVPEDAQTGTLILSFAGTQPGQSETTDTLYVALPQATGVSPTPVKHQTNLTITGTNLDLTKEIRFTGVANPVTTFTKTATQIVVSVPAAAQTGKITLVAASGLTTQTPVDVVVQMPTVTNMTPNPVDPAANLTITGTNLDLVTSVTFQNAPAVTTFVSKTATQIVVKVPMGVTRGKITLGVLNSSLTVQSNEVLEITGAAPPPTIALPIYNDAVTSNWNGWVGNGWGGNKDYNNTAPVREGTKSVKIEYTGGYGSPLQLGGGNLSTTGYTTFKISLYGGPGTTGKKVALGINGSDAQIINLVEGKWTDYEFQISSLTTTGKITEILVKEYTGNAGYTVYADAIGLN